MDKLRSELAASQARCEALEALDGLVESLRRSGDMRLENIKHRDQQILALASENAALRELVAEINGILKGNPLLGDCTLTRSIETKLAALRPGATEPHGEETKNLGDYPLTTRNP